MSKLRNNLFLSFFIMIIILTGAVSSVHAAAFAPAVNVAAGNGPSSIVTGQFVASHIVPTNAAQGKSVTATDTPTFGSPALITNNVFAPEGTAWNNATYAVSLQVDCSSSPDEHCSGDLALTIDLGQPYSGINRVVVQADDNDTYRVEYSLDGLLWTTLYNVPLSSGGGLRTRNSGVLGAVSARYIRIYATSGDGLSSVSELQVFTSIFGIRDVAVANFKDSTVSVMLGNGDGTFTEAAGSPIAVGTSPYAVISADFNNDGNLDLAVANSGSDNVSVLLGNGDGTFTEAVGSPFPVSTTPYALTSGDLDGDGFVDIAVANIKSGNISILIGDGSGSFSATVPAVFPAGSSPTSIVAADFNVDELDEFDVPVVKDELAVADSKSSIAIMSLTKNSDDTYTMTTANKYSVGAGPLILATSDFNGDGMPDLAVNNSNSKNISLFLGVGTNILHFMQNLTVDQFPTAVVAADLNGDGKVDLAVTHLSSDSVSVIYGNGNGKFQSPISFPVGAQPLSVAAADFDSDGRTDLLTANFSANTLSLLINTQDTGVITVTSPVGGEHLHNSTTLNITWDAFPGAVSYVIYQSTDNGSTFKKLAKVGNVTSYLWAMKLAKQSANTNDNLIKIVGYNASKKIIAEGRSKSTFSIEAVSIVFPNGGEILPGGAGVLIGWNTYATSKTPTSVRLSYWDGSKWITITTLNPIPVLPIYTWTLPAVTETRHFYLLKVELRAGSKVVATDITDGFFTIIP